MGVCFALLVQSIKAVPKNIRLNCSVFQLAAFKNKKVILEDIYDEVSNVIENKMLNVLYNNLYNGINKDIENGLNKKKTTAR